MGKRTDRLFICKLLTACWDAKDNSLEEQKIKQKTNYKTLDFINKYLYNICDEGQRKSKSTGGKHGYNK